MILLVTFVDWVKSFCDAWTNEQTHPLSDRCVTRNSDLDQENNVSSCSLNFFKELMKTWSKALKHEN